MTNLSIIISVRGCSGRKISRDEEKTAREKCMDLLKIFDLEQYADGKAKNMPYGQQPKA